MLLTEINGTKVLFEKNSSHIVNIQILVDAGSSDENQAEYGVAHFLEHMMFKGTKTRDAKRINRDADLLGAKLNAWTWHDQTSYHLSVMSDKFEQGFELLSDIFLNSIFPEDELEKERTVIISEIKRYEDDPSMYLSDIAVDYYCDNGLAHKVIGPEESVRNLKGSQLKDFREKYYGGDNVLISIAGGIDFVEIEKVVNKYFFSSQAQKPQTLLTSSYKTGILKLNKADIQENQYQLYYPALPYSDQNAVLQGVMTFILGGNASSFLFERLREELGLCYGIYARVNRFQGFNYIEITSSCSDHNFDIMHSEVLNIIKKITVDYISDERLEMVKSSILSSMFMNIESSAGLNSFLSLAYLRGDREDILNNRIRAIKEVSIKEIKCMAEQTFSKEPLLAKLIS